MIRKITLLLFIASLNFHYCAAQEGLVDRTFNTYDDGLKGDGFDKTVRTLAVQADGKLIVGGDFLNFNGSNLPFLCRLNIDGSVDETFDLGDGFDKKVEKAVIQEDGKIIVAGSFTNYDGFPVGRLLRLNPDGSRDINFDTSIAAQNNIIYDIELQADGKLIVVGSLTKYNGIKIGRIVRLLPDGIIDPSFQPVTGASGLIREVSILKNGKIVIGGTFESYDGISCNKIMQLNPDGSPDTSFNTGSGFDEGVTALDVQADGKIIVGGTFTLYNGTIANKIIRLNSDGSADGTFQSGTGISNSSVAVIEVMPSGSIMVGGGFTRDYNGVDARKIIQLNSDGTINSSFDIGGGPATATVYAFAKGIDGSWFVGGSFSVFDKKNRGRLAKLDSSGALDEDYLSAKVGFNNSVYKAVALKNSQTMIFGNFSTFNGKDASRVARLNEDGSLDDSFNSSGSGANNTVRTAVLQTDGKVIMAGAFTKYNDEVISKIVRLNGDGTTDVTFANGSSINNQIYVLALQDDGKILVGGSFKNYNGTEVNRLVRLLSNGAVDTSFNTGSGPDGTVESIVVQNDGKLIVAGKFLSFNGESYNRLIRLNSDGSIDTAFNTGIGFDKNVYAIALQSDQKIIVGGIFQNYDSVLKKRLVRLNSDGSIDETFLTGKGMSNGTIRSILVQPDDRLIIGGTFTGNYDGSAVKRIARLNADGSFDNSFQVDLNSTLYATAFTAKNKLIIGGNFNSVSGLANHRVARINLCLNSSRWNGSSWSNGIPTSEKSIIFSDDFTSTDSLEGCSCTIAEGKTVTMKEQHSLSLTNNYSGLGQLILNHGASLYQNDDDMINMGVGIVEKASDLMVNSDYSLWSSAVAGQIVNAATPQKDLNTFFTYNAIDNSWVVLDSSTEMKAGLGYRIDAPNNFDAATRSSFTASFQGIPNNGEYQIKLGAINAKKLVGNPYPSDVDADQFLRENHDKINGTIYFWEHDNYNVEKTKAKSGYAVYNLFGGVGIASPKLEVDKKSRPNGKISSGKAFFVSADASNETIIFNNAMRLKNVDSVPSTLDIPNIDKHRLWLSMHNDSKQYKELLVGYSKAATDLYDEKYDGEVFMREGDLTFYSSMGEKQLAIQAFNTFNDSDEIPLGYSVVSAGEYEVALVDYDGLFADKDIYLYDRTTDSIHDTKASSYKFVTNAGVYDNRFKIIFKDEPKDEVTDEVTDDPVVIEDENPEFINQSLMSIVMHNKKLEIAAEDRINHILIYDISGREVYRKMDINSSYVALENILNVRAVYIVKVVTLSNELFTKKVIY